MYEDSFWGFWEVDGYDRCLAVEINLIFFNQTIKKLPLMIKLHQ